MGDNVKEKSSKFKDKISSLSEKNQKKKLKTTRTEVKAKLTVNINIAKTNMRRLKLKRTQQRIHEKAEKGQQQKRRRIFEAAVEKKGKEDAKVEAREFAQKKARTKADLAKKEKESKDLSKVLKKAKGQLAERKTEEKRSKSHLANLEEMTSISYKR